jgi:uncharacterized sulfatase
MRGIFMNRREFLQAGAALALSTGWHGRVAAQDRRLPNFIIIFCDDLGYGDTGAFGGQVIATPHIDRLAREGVRLTNFYAAANVCTPSRAGLLTGRYPIRTGLAHEVIRPSDQNGLEPGEVTIAEALKPDYASAMIGKWHLGHVAPFWPPTVQGFDLFFGLPYSHDMEPLSLYTSQAPGVELTQEDVDFPQLQQRFWRRASQFIEEHREQPFFVNLALSAPHLPSYPHAPFEGHSPAGSYGDVVAEVDDIVGQLRTQLKSLRLDRNTLILFTSDNGPWWEGSTGGLRDRKGNASWEGGYRVPFIAWGLDLPRGSTRNGIAMSIDILPTLCQLAGRATPPGVVLDGLDIGTVLREGGASPHDQLVLFNNEDVVAIRTQRWKYVATTHYRDRVFHLDRSEYGAQLFDLAADMSESYNVAMRHPDIVADMQRRLDAARQEFEPMKIKKK